MEENEKSYTQIGLENLRAKTNYNEKIKQLSEQEHPLYIQAFFNLRYMNEVSMATILGNTATDNSVIFQKNNTNDIPHTDKYLGSYRQTGIEYNTIMPLFNLLIPEIKNKFYTNLFNASYNNGELFFGDFPLTPQNIFILLTKFSGVSHNFSNNIFKINFYENSYNQVLNSVFYHLPSVINNTYVKENLIAEIDPHLTKVFEYVIYQHIKELLNYCYKQDNEIFYVTYNGNLPNQEFSETQINKENVVSFIIDFCEYNDEIKRKTYKTFAAIIEHKYYNEDETKETNDFVNSTMIKINDTKFKSYYLQSFIKESAYSMKNPFYDPRRNFKLINGTLYLRENIYNKIWIVNESNNFYAIAKELFPNFSKDDIVFLIKEVLKHKEYFNITETNEVNTIDVYISTLKNWVVYNGRAFRIYSERNPLYISIINKIKESVFCSVPNISNCKSDSTYKTPNISPVSDLLGRFTNYSVDKTNQLAQLKALSASTISSKELLYIIYAPNHKNEVKKLLEIMTCGHICPLSLKGAENNLKEIKYVNEQHYMLFSNKPSPVLKTLMDLPPDIRTCKSEYSQEMVSSDTIFNEQHSIFLSDDNKLPGNYKYGTLSKLITQTDISKSDSLAGTIHITNNLPIVFLSDNLKTINTLQSEIKKKYVYIDLSDADKSLKGFALDDEEVQRLYKWFDICFSMYGTQLYCNTHNVKLQYETKAVPNKKSMKNNKPKPIDIKSTVENFINDCCEKAEGNLIIRDDMYKAYKKYYTNRYDKNVIPITQLTKKFQDIGYEYGRKRLNGTYSRYIVGLKFIDDIDQKLDSSYIYSSDSAEDIAENNKADKIAAYNAFIEEVNRPAQSIIDEYENNRQINAKIVITDNNE